MLLPSKRSLDEPLKIASNKTLTNVRFGQNQTLILIQKNCET